MHRSGITTRTFVLMAVCTAAFAACSAIGTSRQQATTPAARAVAAGDHVEVAYTCRLADGSIAATTLADADLGAKVPRSALYSPGENPAPILIEAQGPECPLCGEVAVNWGFDDHIAVNMARDVTGHVVGETFTSIIEPLPVVKGSGENGVIRLGRKRTRPGTARIPRDQFENNAGQPAVEGMSADFGPGVPGVVTGVYETRVEVRYSPQDGAVQPTPFGPARVVDEGDGFSLVIDPGEGGLVRTGPLAGRIVDVGEESFSVDYNDPFAYEKLYCEATVVSAKPPFSPASKQAEPGLAETGTENAEPDDKAAAGQTSTNDVLKDALANAVEGGDASVDADEARVIAEDPDTIQTGDLVYVNYTARLSDGSVFATTDPAVDADPAETKAYFYARPPVFLPEGIVAGKDGPLPAVAGAVIGHSTGDVVRAAATPEDGFGNPDPQKMQRFPRIKVMPLRTPMAPKDYVNRFGGFPRVGDKVNMAPYFPSSVVEVTGAKAVLEHEAGEDRIVRDELGAAEIRVDDGHVFIRLTPDVGAPFAIENRTGRITAVEEDVFVADFNPPLAGKDFTVDMEIVDVEKASGLADRSVEWIEDYERALDAGRDANQPVALVLYAPWCQWSKKLIEETFTDPRVTDLAGDVVMARVDAEKRDDVGALYNLDSFPLLVILDTDGEVVKRMQGFTHARVLARELAVLTANNR